MAKRLDFEFRLMDKFSSPAGKAGGAAMKMSVALRDLGDAATKAEKKTLDAGRAARGMAVDFDAALRVGGRVVGVVESVGNLGLSFAEAAVDAASFKESATVALGTVMGSADKAGKVLKDTIGLAAKLPITTQDAISQMNKLALAGVTRGEMPRLLIGASDVRALNPGRGEQASDSFIKQMGLMDKTGASDRNLKALSREANISELGVLKNLSKMFSGAPEKDIKAALSKGLIGAQDVQRAVLQTLAGMEGGKLGGASMKSFNTVDELQKKLQGRKFEVFLDLDESPAYASYRGFLKNLVDFTDPSSAFGQRIKTAVGRTFGGTFSRVFDDFSGPNGAMQMEKVLNRALRAAELVGVALQGGVAGARGFAIGLEKGLGLSDDLFTGPLDEKKIAKLVTKFEEMGHIIGETTGDLTKLLGLIVKLKDPNASVADKAGTVVDIAEKMTNSHGAADLVKTAVDWMPMDTLMGGLPIEEVVDSFSNLGKLAGLGFNDGLSNVSPVTAVDRFSGDATDAMRKTLEIHSPSRVFEQLGRYSAEGYMQGLEGAGGDTSDALANMVRMPARSGAGGRGRPAVNLKVQLIVDGSGSAGAAAQSIKDQLEEQLPSAFQSLFESLLMQGG